VSTHPTDQTAPADPTDPTDPTALTPADEFRQAGRSYLTADGPGRPCPQKEALMSTVVAGITMSVDGYITGPDDRPGCGLGVGGERLHYWVFGGPWTYDSVGGEPVGEDKEWFDETLARNGAVVTGRGTNEAAEHWGGHNPWTGPSSWSPTALKSSLRAMSSSSWAASRRPSSRRRRRRGRSTST
jgi:hypothetical protein